MFESEGGITHHNWAENSTSCNIKDFCAKSLKEYVALKQQRNHFPS